MSSTEMLAFLDRIVVGGVRDLPLTRAREVMQAVKLAMKEIADPNS